MEPENVLLNSQVSEKYKLHWAWKQELTELHNDEFRRALYVFLIEYMYVCITIIIIIIIIMKKSKEN
jgi:Trk-type K+ transport system membrane component